MYAHVNHSCCFELNKTKERNSLFFFCKIEELLKSWGRQPHWEFFKEAKTDKNPDRSTKKCKGSKRKKVSFLIWTKSVTQKTAHKR